MWRRREIPSLGSWSFLYRGHQRRERIFCADERVRQDPSHTSLWRFTCAEKRIYGALFRLRVR